MVKMIIGLTISIFLFFQSNYVLANEIPQKKIDNLSKNFSKKFSKTFCNTSNFGISDEGAIEFALGETSKQFSKNKYLNYLDLDDVSKKIITNIENECQVFDFPVEELSKLQEIIN